MAHQCDGDDMSDQSGRDLSLYLHGLAEMLSKVQAKVQADLSDKERLMPKTSPLPPPWLREVGFGIGYRYTLGLGRLETRAQVFWSGSDRGAGREL